MSAPTIRFQLLDCGRERHRLPAYIRPNYCCALAATLRFIRIGPDSLVESESCMFRHRVGAAKWSACSSSQMCAMGAPAEYVRGRSLTTSVLGASSQTSRMPLGDDGTSCRSPRHASFQKPRFGRTSSQDASPSARRRTPCRPRRGRPWRIRGASLKTSRPEAKVFERARQWNTMCSASSAESIPPRERSVRSRRPPAQRRQQRRHHVRCLRE